MADEIKPAADATAKPADVKVETKADAVPAADAKVETKEASAAEVTNKADSPDQSGAKNAPNDKEAKPDDKPAVPEKYEFVLSKDSPLDASDVSKFEAEAKAKGLSQEQAQERLIEREELKRGYFNKQQEAQTEALHQLHRSWAEELATDKEFGGPKLKETAEHAKRFLDRYGDDALRSALNDKVMRWGDNPTLLRAFARAGRAMANDKLVTDGKAGAAPKARSGDVHERAKGSLYGATHNKE